MSQKITVLIGVNDFFDRPGSGLFISIFICLHGDLLRDLLLPPFWDFPGNCTSFSGNSLLNPFLLKKTRAPENMFSCICFSLWISVFVAITRLGVHSFAETFPEKTEMYWSNLKAKGYLLSLKLVNSKIPLDMSSWQKWHYSLW